VLGLRDRLLLWVAAIVAAGAVLVVVGALPFVLGMSFADGPDPDRPGHLKGVDFMPEMLGALAILAECIVVGLKLVRKQRSIQLANRENYLRR
jgi:hypothetical protein